ncbi:hypothetical protein QZM22_26520, partial [Burkholderia oklahomensis]|uniref:hypothetical protein n=1 Tax=Burkholderia oklahomensis TaxID=342113 RepID=UPI00264DCD6B
GDNHLWLFAQGNGAVFHAGPSSQMNWISTAGGVARSTNRAAQRRDRAMQKLRDSDEAAVARLA